MALILAGCGQFGTGARSVPPIPKIQSAGPASSASGTLIVEPQAGPAPYLSLVQSARRSVDVNSYLLTDRALVSALVQKARAGVSVRVIVDGHPYEDQRAVSQERAEFAGTNVQFRLAPAEFERPYVFDHAKYVVVDAGRGGRAILGSSNLDYSGLGGGNREYDYETADPGVVAALAAIFDADWAGKSVQVDKSGPLVISPGSESQLVNLIQGARQRLYIESEELGDDRPVLDAVAAAARRGVQVEMVLPNKLNWEDRRNAQELVNAGAKVKYLGRPYPHAKLIIADDRAFVGSQNISDSSLSRNREIGIIIGGSAVNQAMRWFRQDFLLAR